MNQVLNIVTITPVYAALLGLVLLALCVRVIVSVRAKGGMRGEDGNPDPVALIRRHGSFIEFMPNLLMASLLLLVRQ